MTHGRAPLEQAWRALGGAGTPALELHGGTRFLGSPFALDEIATATIGAALLAAGELAQARGQPKPAVALDRAHAALAFASERQLRTRATAALDAPFAALSRFASTSDGHIRLHANYPHHRAALLRALGDPPERAALAAIATRRAAELEQAIVDAGGAAAAVRSPAQWSGHAQGRAVAPLGLLDFEPRRTPAPPLAPAGPLPCSGLRVLDLTRVIAGPVGTRMLAALGAEVLRIDPPAMPELELQVLDGCVGKRSTLLDLRVETECATLEQLLAEADVVVQGYRPGALARFGLEPAALRTRHPRLVTVTLSAWGETGPWARRRGFDSLVQAACGIALACGDGNGPGALPVQALDHASGYLIAAGALRGLAIRAREARAVDVRVALTRTAAWVMGHLAPDAELGQLDAERYLVEVPSPRGPLRCLAPPGSLDGRALTWPRGVPAPGGDPPRWPAPARA
jgi:CoA-transferase family III